MSDLDGAASEEFLLEMKMALGATRLFRSAGFIRIWQERIISSSIILQDDMIMAGKGMEMATQSQAMSPSPSHLFMLQAANMAATLGCARIAVR